MDARKVGYGVLVEYRFMIDYLNGRFISKEG